MGNDNHLNAVREEDESSRPASPMMRPYSTGFPESLDVPESVNTARNSLATLISALDQELKMPPPPSAASEVTLFDFNPSEDGVAESTPHESKTQARRRSREPAPPVPQLPNNKASRRSSIIYIKSDENTSPVNAIASTSSTSVSSESSQQWSTRAVRPLIPKSKAHKLQPKTRKLDDQENVAVSPRQGLRPLSLLQSHDMNRGSVVDVVSSTQPLSIGGKGKKKQSRAEGGENVRRESSLKRALKPLKLMRNETTKERAVLRQREVLPDVVVRPPSDGQHIGFAYNFAR